MRIENVIIEDRVKEKILNKHGITAAEIRNVFLGRLLVMKTRLGRYTAIGLHHRYITIIFGYSAKTANIRTAYPSSAWQVKLYKRKAG